MRAYLTAHAAKQHEQHFGWKTFSHSIGTPLFCFATREELRASDPLGLTWRDGTGNGRLFASLHLFNQ